MFGLKLQQRQLCDIQGRLFEMDYFTKTHACVFNRISPSDNPKGLTDLEYVQQ